MASELYHLTKSNRYNAHAQEWLGNILGTNSWGSSRGGPDREVVSDVRLENGWPTELVD